MTLDFGYDCLARHSNGGITIEPFDPRFGYGHRKYTWSYWIPALAGSSQGRFRLRSVDELLRENKRFVYPVELLWWWLEETTDCAPSEFLTIPARILECTRRGQAILLLFFGHEARALSPRAFQLISEWTEANALPSSGVWFIDGNLTGGDGWKAWMEDSGQRSPFQYRCGEPLTLLTRQLLAMAEAGRRLELVRGMYEVGRPTARNFTRVRETEAAGALWHYPSPTSLRVELRTGVLRQKLFVSMNRYPRWHRRWLISHLEASRALQQGMVSLRDDPCFDDPMEDPLLEPAWRRLRPRLPLEIDRRHPPPDSPVYWEENFSALTLGEPTPYHACYFNFVTESTMDDGICCISEKILKPIATCQPFIVLGAHGALRYIRSLGFRTFGPLLDESYDEVDGAADRVRQCLQTVDRVTAMTLRDAHEVYRSVESALVGNFELLRVVRTPFESIFEDLASWSAAG